MAYLTEESLSKLSKQELIAMMLKDTVKAYFNNVIRCSRQRL